MNQQQLIEELTNCAANSVASMSITPNTDWTSNYWNFREQAWKLQRENNISGLIKKTLNIRNCTYEILEAESQLILLPSDIVALRTEKDRMVEIFLSHAYDIYEHLQDMADLNDYPYILVPVSRLHQRANKSDWAELCYFEHCDELSLNLGCGNDPETSKYRGNKYTRDAYSFTAPAWNMSPSH